MTDAVGALSAGWGVFWAVDREPARELEGRTRGGVRWCLGRGWEGAGHVTLSGSSAAHSLEVDRVDLVWCICAVLDPPSLGASRAAVVGVLA